jgi:hypothetical protein
MLCVRERKESKIEPNVFMNLAYFGKLLDILELKSE